MSLASAAPRPGCGLLHRRFSDAEFALNDHKGTALAASALKVAFEALREECLSYVCRLPIDRLAQRQSRAAYVEQHAPDKLIEHREYIRRHCEEMPEIRNLRWGG